MLGNKSALGASSAPTQRQLLKKQRSHQFGLLTKRARGASAPVGLDPERLTSLMRHLSRNYCDDMVEVKNMLQFYVELATERKQNAPQHPSSVPTPQVMGRSLLAGEEEQQQRWRERRELEDIADALETIVSNAPHVPPEYVSQVHSMIGLIQQQAEHNLGGGDIRDHQDRAIISFTKALWIETTSTPDSPDVQEIGLTLHRLAISHSKCRNYGEAARLFGKALAMYRSLGLREDHVYIQSARSELAKVLEDKFTFPSSTVPSQHNGELSASKRRATETAIYKIVQEGRCRVLIDEVDSHNDGEGEVYKNENRNRRKRMSI